MAKATVTIKIMDDDNNVDEWQGTYDLDTSTGNVVGLLKRIRIIVRREFIRRSLLTATEDDRSK
jgi:hypothetical protein